MELDANGRSVTMQAEVAMSFAHRIKVKLGPDRRLEVVLPDEFPAGAEAEVIVLSDAALTPPHESANFHLLGSPRLPADWVDLPLAGGTAMPSTTRYHREDLYSDKP